MAAEDKMFYVNLSLLRDKVKSYDAFTVSAIAAAGLVTLMAVGVMTVTRKGLLTMGFVLFTLITLFVMMVLLFFDSRETAQGIEKQIQAMKTKYYDDIQALECPMFFTKQFKPETRTFMCENTDAIRDGEDALQPVRPKPDSPDAAYPWAVVVPATLGASVPAANVPPAAAPSG